MSKKTHTDHRNTVLKIIQGHREAVAQAKASDKVRGLDINPRDLDPDRAHEIISRRQLEQRQIVNDLLIDHRATSSASLNKVSADVAERRQAALDRAEQARAKLTQPSGDQSTELRATRYWNRTERTLRNQTSPAAIAATAQRLWQSATADERVTLLEELPAYLEASNAPTVWLEFETRTAFPDYAAAINDVKIVERLALITDQNVRKAEEALATADERKIPDDRSVIDPARYERPTSVEEAAEAQKAEFAAILRGEAA